MNIFFCCVKRDSTTLGKKQTKESLYNFIINEKLSKNKKKGEDSESKVPTNIDEGSNESAGDLVNLNDKDGLLKNGADLQSSQFKSGNKLDLAIDSESMDHYEYLIFERESKDEWVLEKDKEDLKVWTKMVLFISFYFF